MKINLSREAMIGELILLVYTIILVADVCVIAVAGDRLVSFYVSICLRGLISVSICVLFLFLYVKIEF